MNGFFYYLLGAAFAFTCFSISLFIRKKKIGKYSQARIGLIAIIISWACGLGILAVAILG